MTKNDKGEETIVPETATRREQIGDFHTGRGGQGNIGSGTNTPRREGTPEVGEGRQKESVVQKVEDKVKGLFHKA